VNRSSRQSQHLRHQRSVHQHQRKQTFRNTLMKSL
jgi:hypothetical protein